MKLSIIVAASENHVIGRQGDLPWRLSADLRRFKSLTMGHCLIMGRKTYESIGRPLPGRVSIVLSRKAEDDVKKSPTTTGGGARGGGQATPSNLSCVPQRPTHQQDLLHATSLENATKLVTTTNMSHKEAFITGGGEIYRLALQCAERIYRTVVHTTIDGDATFPEVDWSAWQLLESQPHPADDKNEFDYTFEVWQRK